VTGAASDPGAGSGHLLRAEVPVMEVFRLVNARLPPHAVVGGEAALGPRYPPPHRELLPHAPCV